MLGKLNKWMHEVCKPLNPFDRRPEVTQEMKNRGTTWRKLEDAWVEVCDFCGGNCGQCGLTGRLGNIPASFERIVNNSGMTTGKAVGFPRE